MKQFWLRTFQVHGRLLFLNLFTLLTSFISSLLCVFSFNPFCVCVSECVNLLSRLRLFTLYLYWVCLPSIDWIENWIFTKSFFQIRSFVLTQKTFWLQTVIAFCWFKCLNLLFYIIQVYPAHLPTTGPPRLWPVHPQAGGAGLTDLLFKIKSNNLPKK